jgi:hypothetical protein
LGVGPRARTLRTEQCAPAASRRAGSIPTPDPEGSARYWGPAALSPPE